MEEVKEGLAVSIETAKLLFVIRNNGKEYRIYTNGRVEGFGGTVGVVNYFPRQEYTSLIKVPVASSCNISVTDVTYPHVDFPHRASRRP